MARGSKPAIAVEGARELARALKGLEGGLDDLKDVHRETGEIVAQEAKEIVPHRSGALGRSIRATRRRAGATVAAGRGRVPYAGPIHFGWRRRNIEPQPFLYEALDRRRDAVIATYHRGVDRLVSDAKRKMPR
jgi:hypothetical protein